MYEFVSESFRLENTFEYILSIQVSLNGFSFSIRQEESDELVLLKTAPLKVSSKDLLSRRFQDWYNNEELLQKPYKRTNVIVLSNSFTLLPKQYSGKATLEEIPHVLFNEAEKMEFAENHIESINATILFALPKNLNNTIQQTIGYCTIWHPVKALLNARSSSEDKQISVYMDDKDLFLMVHKSNELVFCNSFRVNHANDIVYYALSVLKQLDIKTKDTIVKCAGNSAFSKDIYQLLPSYFKSVTFFSQAIKNTGIKDEGLIDENISLFFSLNENSWRKIQGKDI